MKRYHLLFCLAVWLVAGCVPMETLPSVPVPACPVYADPADSTDPADPDQYGHTMLLYMVSPSLQYSFLSNLKELRRGDSIPANQALLVYIDTGCGAELLRVRTAADGTVKVRAVRTFSNTVESTSQTRIDTVWRYVQQRYPAVSYGMLLSGHGNGWAPFRISTKSIFTEPAIEQELTIASLAEVLPSYHLDYLVLDACHMGGIEVCYELRNACKYIMASATEIWGTGYVYDRLAETMFPYTGISSVEAYAQAYFQKYREPDNYSGGATVAVIQTSELEDLATAFKAVYVSGISVADVTTYNMQHYDREELVGQVTKYDLKEFASRLLPSDGTYADFLAQLSLAVTYKETSTKFGSSDAGWITIDPLWYSGLSCFVPNNMYPVLQGYYAATAWNLNVGLVTVE